MSSTRKITAYLLALLLLAPSLAVPAPPCDADHASSAGKSSQPESIAPAPTAMPTMVATRHEHSATTLAPAASDGNRSTRHHGHAMNAGQSGSINSAGGDQSTTNLPADCPCCDDCISSCALTGTSLLLGAIGVIEPLTENRGLPAGRTDNSAYPPPPQSLFRPPITRS